MSGVFCKTCNGGGYCLYRFMHSMGWGCNYEGYCDYQRPMDSRAKPFNLGVDVGGITSKGEEDGGRAENGEHEG